VDPAGLLVVACALEAGGSVLQKHSVASRVPAMPFSELLREPRRFFGPVARDPLWLLGFVCLLAGAGMALQVMADVDLTIVKSLGRIGTLFAALAGVLFLGERLSRRELAALTLMVLGGLALAAEAGHETGAAASGQTQLVLVVGVAAALALLAALRHRAPARLSAEVALALAAGLLIGTADALVKEATWAAESSAAVPFHVLDPASLGALLRTPQLLAAAPLYLAATALAQAAYAVGRLSVIAPALGIGAVLLPLVFGFAAFGESLAPQRLLGIAALLTGAALFWGSPRPCGS
jgi:drug/metabolite transporter (DMT)-like permease